LWNVLRQLLWSRGVSCRGGIIGGKRKEEGRWKKRYRGVLVTRTIPFVHLKLTWLRAAVRKGSVSVAERGKSEEKKNLGEEVEKEKKSQTVVCAPRKAARSAFKVGEEKTQGGGEEKEGTPGRELIAEKGY